VDYAYGTDFTLGNSGDEIILLAGGTVIHSIGYGGYKDTPRAIMSNAGPSPTQGVATGMALDYCHGSVNSWALQTTPTEPWGTGDSRGGQFGSGGLPAGAPRFLAATLSGNQLILKLDWQRHTDVVDQRAWAVDGNEPHFRPPQTVNLVPGENQFFRIQAQ